MIASFVGVALMVASVLGLRPPYGLLTQSIVSYLFATSAISPGHHQQSLWLRPDGEFAATGVGQGNGPAWCSGLSLSATMIGTGVDTDPLRSMNAANANDNTIALNNIVAYFI